MEKSEKFFIITIDTEGDNQWDNENGITTRNAKFLPRFQELAEKYDFRPVWLTNYEMVCDDFFVNYMKPRQEKGLCEIGMHLHAWNNPPEYKLEKINNERDYLIEYPEDIMKDKILNLVNLIADRFGEKPVSHRSGRWAIDEKYLKLLSEEGFLVDCSVTPHVNWSNCLGSTGLGGTDYTYYSEKSYFVDDKLLEIPVTIKKIHNYQFGRVKCFKNVFGELKRFTFGRTQWIRPDKYLNFDGIKRVIDMCNKNGEYIMFMIHSSELMPDGSPNFKTNEEIEKLYILIEKIFNYVYTKGYRGILLKDFYKRQKELLMNE